MTDRDHRPACTCGHPRDEHTVYGCTDGCACEWTPSVDDRRGGPNCPCVGCEDYRKPVQKRSDDDQDDSYAPDPRDERCGGCGEPKNDGQLHGHFGGFGGCV